MKINLKTVALSVALVVAAFTTDAQNIQNGNIINFTKYSGMDGSPYFNPYWVQGNVKFRNGSTKNAIILYDELKDYVFYQGENEELVQFEMPVYEFTIAAEDGTIAHFSKFAGNGKFPDEAFFQVLSDGKVKLLKRNSKSVSEHKEELGSAVTKRDVVDNIDYFLLIEGKVVKIKKDKKSILQTLNDGNKQQDLDNYITTNKLNLKKDSDLIKLMDYYNTL
jgi:hypothetical protein